MRVSDGETIKNVLVNVVPLGILVYFALLFVIFDAGENPYFLAISIGLLVIPFTALALVTYLSARAISTAEASRCRFASTVDDNL